LKAHRASVGGLAASNVGELQAIVREQDDLIAAIEAQIDRLRKLLLLREQFIALITEISTFILTYTGVVRDIETSGQDNEEKIKRYRDVRSPASMSDFLEKLNTVNFLAGKDNYDICHLSIAQLESDIEHIIPARLSQMVFCS